MKKLPAGNRLHRKESKYNKRFYSCWEDCETNDHLLQCPKQSRHTNKIYQAITRPGTETDQSLCDILRDGVRNTAQGQYVKYGTLIDQMNL